MLLRIFNDMSFPAQRSARKTEKSPGDIQDHPTATIKTDQIKVDVKGTALSTHLRISTENLEQGVRDVSHDLDLVNAIDTPLQKQSGLIIQLRDLASEAATESIGATEREEIDLEFERLKEKLEQIDNLQVLDSQNLKSLEKKINLEELNNELSGLSHERLTTQQKALSAMDTLVKALDKLESIKTETISARNQLEKAMGSLNIKIENFSAAEPAARDAKSASELTRFTREQILAQSATAMVGQANLIPQGVFELVEEL